MLAKSALYKLTLGFMFLSFFSLTAQQTLAQCNGVYFKNSTRKVVTNLPVSIEKVDDFNGDGKPDVAGFDRTNGNFVVFLNDGAGNFGNPISTFVGTGVSELFLVGDFNSDNKKDLIVKRNTNPVSVVTFTGNGDGTFTQWNTTTFNQFSSFYYQKIVRFDNDPRPQILAGNFYYPINSDGTLAPGNPLNGFNGSELFGDFNGDGKTDFAKYVNVNGTPTLFLDINNGNGTFIETTLATGEVLGPTEAADLNNDGKDDILTVERTGGDKVVIFLSSPSGAFTRVNTNEVNYTGYGFLGIGDFNGDGFKDVIGLGTYAYTIYFGNTSGTFTQSTFSGGAAYNDFYADFDGDGKTDFIQAFSSSYFATSVFVISKNVCTVQGRTRIVDFDGDGRTDPAMWRASDGRWTIINSIMNETSHVFWGLGSLGDVPVPGDYDGDGKTDIAVWRNTNGGWYIRRSSDNAFQSVSWGATGDKPVQGDFDGDGKSDTAVFRPSTGAWFVRQSSNSQLYAVQFGIAEDIPVPADYDGDGKADVAVFRPSNNTWYILKSSDGGFIGRQWGAAGDKPAPGDYDGDGKADVAVFRPSNATWYLTSGATGTYLGFQFGTNGDVIVPGSYQNSSELMQVAIYRPNINRWYINFSNSFNYYDLGEAGEIPVSSLPRTE